MCLIEFCSLWLSLFPCPSCWCWPEVCFIFTFQADQINPVLSQCAKWNEEENPAVLCLLNDNEKAWKKRENVVLLERSITSCIVWVLTFEDLVGFGDDESLSNAATDSTIQLMQRGCNFFFFFWTLVSEITSLAALLSLLEWLGCL